MRKIATITLCILLQVVSAYSQVNVNETFSEREVMMKTPTGNLYGTLTIPMENKLGIVALIIPGSGATDRDGNTSTFQGKNNSLKMLAEGLAKEGISSLRIDKRGIAKSKGAALAEADLRFEDMVEDAVSWLRFLKNDDKRFKQLAVIGHSEGSLVGMLAAKIADADYYVSIAGSGRPAHELLKEQLSKQLIPPLLDTVNLYISMLKEGKHIEKPNPLFMSLFRPSVQSYVISWFKYSPSEEVAKLRSKVLLIQGTTDIQVGLADFEALATACPKANLAKIEGMNHVLKHVGGTMLEQLPSYGNPDLPLSEGLVEEVVAFLKSNR